MSRDPSDTNAHLPPWLRGQPLPARPEDGQSGSEPSWLNDPGTAQVNAASSENLPSWLSDTPAEPAGGESLPDWLREAPANAGSQSIPPAQEWASETDDTSDDSASEAIPDWLRGLDDAQDTQPAASTTPAAGVPDWLLAMVEETPAEAPPAAPVPDWLSETPVETGDTTPNWLAETPAEMPATTSDWLRDEPAPIAATTPDWLRDEPTSQPAEVAPDRLSDTPSQPMAANENNETGDIALWLQDISTDQVKAAMDEEDEPLGATPFSFDSLDHAASASLPAAAASGPPSWLGSDSNEDSSTWFDPPPAATPTPAPRDLADDDAPDWLSDTAMPAAESSEVPNWLDQADMTILQPAAESPGEANIYQAPAEDIPAWLRGNAESFVPEATPAWLDESDNAAMQPVALERSPDWLGAAEPSTTPPVALPPIDATPDWLREAAIEPPISADEGLPTWLRSDASTPTQPAPIQAVPVDSDLPPWLRDESGARLPTADAPGEQNLPPWLKGSTTDTASAEVPAATPELAPELQPVSPVDDWFDQPLASNTVETAELVESESEFFGGTDLPAWLRPKEKKLADGDAAEGRALDWLTRLGSPEEEDAAPIAAPVRLIPPQRPARSAEQVRAVALLEQLAAAPMAQPAPTDAVETKTHRSGHQRVLYLLLLAALLVGIIAPSLIAPLEVPPIVPGAQTLRDQIGALGENDVVLIGYDWDARRVAELRPLEDAVIGQLIEQKVKLVLMSTDPQGSLLLYDLRDNLRANGYAQYGDDYILLGYQPGGELALRAMAQNFGQFLSADFNGTDVSTGGLATGASTGTNQPLDSLNDFSMIMLLADDQVDVQSWMEQVQRTARDVPFSVLLTAEAAPSAAPYLRQPNVFGLSGTDGALAYQALRGADTSVVASSAAQLRLGMIAFVVLLLFSMVVAAIMAAVRRRNA